MHEHSRRNEGGSALVLALIAAFLLFIVSFEVSHAVRIESFIHQNLEVDTKLEVACRAGLEKALAILREDRQQTEIDSTNDAWWTLIVDSELIESDLASDEFLFDDTRSYAGIDDEYDTELIIQIFDESAKFNVYNLLEDDALEERKAREKFANVIDKFRQDFEEDMSYSDGLDLASQIVTFLQRTQENPYLNVPKPLTKSDRTLAVLGELLYVDGITPAMMWDLPDEEGTGIIPGLYRFVTIWSDLQININTGELPAIAGLFENKDVEIAERIIQFRTDKAEEDARTENYVSETGSFDPNAAEEEDPTGGAPFTQINELREADVGITQEIYNEISKFITVQSSVFTVFVTAKRGLIRRTKMWVIRRTEAGPRIQLERLVEFPYFINGESLSDAEDLASENAGY